MEPKLVSPPPVTLPPPPTPIRAKAKPARSAPSLTASPPQEGDDLRSDRGIDYGMLQISLASGDLKEADRETYLAILKLVNRQEGDRLRVQDVPNLPYTDLRTINQLWVKYTQGRFGFSVQARIWKHPKINQDWTAFTHQVGWRNAQGSLRKYEDMLFKLEAPLGHLPLGAGVPQAFWLGYGPCLAAIVTRLTGP